MPNQRRKQQSNHVGAAFTWMVALLIFSSSFPILAAEQAGVDSKLPQPTISLPLSAPSNSAEILALKEQNKIIKEYQSDLMDTVLWALGVVVTLSLLFAGFGWFTNFKMYEADKGSLRDEFARKIDDFDRNLEAKLALNQANNLSALDSRLDSLSAQALTERGAARAERESDQTRMRAEMEAIQALLASIIKRLDSHERKVWLTNANLRIVEETVWQVAKIPTNILISQGQALEAAVEANEEGYVKHILTRMKLTLNQEFVSKRKKFEGNMLDMFNDRLREAESFDAVAVNEIRVLLAQANDSVEPVETAAET